MRLLYATTLVLLLTACNDETCKWKTDKDKQERIFLACLDKAKSFATLSVGRTEMEYVVDDCQRSAFSISTEYLCVKEPPHDD